LTAEVLVVCVFWAWFKIVDGTFSALAGVEIYVMLNFEFLSIDATIS
jgi:hypothetical protein